MARKTISDRRAEALARMDALKREMAELDAKAGERIGRLAVRAGLADLDLDDDTLLKAFGELAGRFRGRSKESARTHPTDAGPA